MSPISQVEFLDGDLVLYPAFFRAEVADQLLYTLSHDIAWKSERIKLYGKYHSIPRLTAWYGDPGKIYRYSGIKAEPNPWTGTLAAIKHSIESLCRTRFNSVLLNLYRKGSDSVSWHSDNEPELGANPIIASVSLGQKRKFQLKHKCNKALKQSIVLTHGSLLIMRGETQKNWLHRLPKSSCAMAPRINLTFRLINP